MKVPELLAAPWAIARPAYEAIVQVAREGGGVQEAKARAIGLTPEAMLRLSGEQPHDELDVRDGVAVIPVRGYLTRRSYWRGDRASYEWIGARLEEALGRYNVKAIVFEVDSGGGEVNGTEELASKIRAARGRKPITAYVLGQAASAAYWIASAASRVVVGRTSMVGSVGVIWSYIDWSKYDARIGIEEIAIVSSQSPDKALDPKTEHGRSRVQTTVDQLAGVFVGDVARNRGKSDEQVIADFGQGWVLVGAEAVSAGMADRVGTFDQAISDEPDFDPASEPTPAAAGEENSMKSIDIASITAEWLDANLPDLMAGIRASATTAVKAEHEAAIVAAVEKAKAEATEAATKAAVSAATEAERARVLGIQAAAHGMGLSKLVAELVADSAITIDGAKAKLFEAMQAQRSGQLNALAQDEAENDAPAADGGDQSAEATARAAMKVANDYAFRHAQRR